MITLLAACAIAYILGKTISLNGCLSAVMNLLGFFILLVIVLVAMWIF